MKPMLRFCAAMCAIVAVFAFAQGVMADTVATVDGYGPYQTGTGGEFTLYVSAGLAPYLSAYTANTKNQGSTLPNFQTFCLEENEFINQNTTYNAVLNTGAVNGGNGGPNPDPISVGTAWLYYNFATGNLANYNYGAGRAASAAALQNTIWWLEQEAADPGAGNVFRTAVLAQFGNSAAAAMADNNGAYAVQVLNLTTLAGGLAQDMLIVTPIPGALILLGPALLGLAGFRKRIFG